MPYRGALQGDTPAAALATVRIGRGSRTGYLRTAITKRPSYVGPATRMPSSGVGVVKDALTKPQVDLLRQIAAASGATPIPPVRIQTSWALEQRGLVKRTWRGSGHVAVVTGDGRYYLKHSRHPRQVRAEKKRLENDAAQAARAPADGAELITRGRWRAAYYDALHHGHVPERHKLRWNGRQRGDCVFTLVDEGAEKAAQPRPDSTRPPPTPSAPTTWTRASWRPSSTERCAAPAAETLRGRRQETSTLFPARRETSAGPVSAHKPSRRQPSIERRSSSVSRTTRRSASRRLPVVSAGPLTPAGLAHGIGGLGADLVKAGPVARLKSGRGSR